MDPKERQCKPKLWAVSCNFKYSRSRILKAKKCKINFHIFHLLQYIHSVMVSISNQYEILRTIKDSFGFFFHAVLSKSCVYFPLTEGRNSSCWYFQGSMSATEDSDGSTHLNSTRYARISSTPSTLQDPSGSCRPYGSSPSFNCHDTDNQCILLDSFFLCISWLQVWSSHLDSKHIKNNIYFIPRVSIIIPDVTIQWICIHCQRGINKLCQ